MIWRHLIEQNSEKKLYIYIIFLFSFNLQETFYLNVDLNVGKEMCT